MLRLPEPLSLPENSRVTVTIESADNTERGVWLKVSEDKLAQAWGDSDDVFNELLKK